MGFLVLSNKWVRILQFQNEIFFYLDSPPEPSVTLELSFYSQPKHNLWVLKRTISMRLFF